MQHPAKLLFIVVGFINIFCISCVSNPVPFSENNEFICKDEGFCLAVNNGTLFYGAYRVKDRELQFQIAYTSWSPMLLIAGGTRYCGRIFTDEHHVIVDDGGGCRSEWEHFKNKYGIPNLEPYKEIGQQLDAYLQNTSHPAGREGEWNELKFLANIVANLKLQTAPTTQQKEAHDAAYTQQMDPEQEKMARENNETVDNLRLQQSLRENELLLQLNSETNSHADAQVGGDPIAEQSHGLGWFGRHIMHDSDKITLAQFIEDPTLEFHQTVDIWAQKFEELGIHTGSDHSSVYITVWARYLGSGAAWQLYATHFTKNHGAEPGQGRMQLRRTCGSADLPITQQYYIWGGECEGTWLGSHTCNDDAAYQIRSAHGIWTETNGLGEGKCQRTHRYNAPNCTIPW